MGHIRRPENTKLIAGLLYRDMSVFIKTRAVLERMFGKIDFESQELDFVQTGYYRDEMGEDLRRKFLGFERPANPARAYISKIKTNVIEARFSRNGKRAINIDPGILSLSKLILFTTKDYSHRIYIKDGIFAEITLHFENNGYVPWPWTYPDYRQDSYADIFYRMRNTLKRGAKEER